MMGDNFIFHKKDFLNVVTSVYSIAFCCKEFYGLTQRERKLLINAAQWARFDRQFFLSEPRPTRIKQDDNIKSKTDEIQEIFSTPSYIRTSLYKDLTTRLPPLDTFNTNVVLDTFNTNSEFKPLNLDKIFEEIKVTELLVDENQTNTEQRQPSDSQDKWNCVIQ